MHHTCTIIMYLFSIICTKGISFEYPIMLDLSRYYCSHTIFCLGIELTLVILNVMKSSIRDAAGDDKENLKASYNLLMKHIIGLIVASLALLTNNSRDEKDLTDLHNRGVLNEDDFRFFMSINAQPVHAVTKLMDLVHESFRKGLSKSEHGTSQATMTLMHNTLLSLRQNISNVYLYVDVQVAYPFIQIISAVVYCFLIQLFFVCAAFISRGIAENDTSYMITGFLTIVLYNFVLLGLLRLYDILANPLGDDAADFPMYTYISRYEKTLKDIVKDGLTLIEIEEVDSNWPSAYQVDRNGSMTDVLDHPMKSTTAPIARFTQALGNE